MRSDELEFEQIFAAFQPKIHRFLIQMVGEYDAEDLTQEVFIRINQAMDAFRGDSELSTWIYRIATNAAFDRLRSPSYRRIIQMDPSKPGIANGEPEIDDLNINEGEKTPLVEPQIYRKEMNSCIQSFVNNLPETYRMVLVLSEFEDLSNKAVAEILGITLSTVKIRLHRAREKLKEQLAANCGSEWVEGNEFVPALERPDMKALG